MFIITHISENTVTVEPVDGAGISRTLNRQDVMTIFVQWGSGIK